MVANERTAIDREIDALLGEFGEGAGSDEIRSVALSRMDELLNDGWDERPAWSVAHGAAWIAGVDLPPRHLDSGRGGNSGPRTE